MDRRDFMKTSALGVVTFGLGGLFGHKIATKNTFDTIIKNGVVYVGDGKPGIKGDVAIKGGKIAAIGQDLGDSADLVLDAKGLTVCPGFIDIHTHTDTNLFDAPKGDSRIYQGITSEVGGNCGHAPFVGPGSKWPMLIIAKPATAAVSVRSILFPNDTLLKPCFSREAISSRLKPPSGPTIKETLFEDLHSKKLTLLKASSS